MRLFSYCLIFLVVLLVCIAAFDVLPPSTAQANQRDRVAAIQKLESALLGRGRVKTNRATGMVDFARLDRETPGSLVEADRATSPEGKARAFLRAQGAGFGINNADSDLRLTHTQIDQLGAVHLTFDQVYEGVPVFAGTLKLHFNAAAELRAVNGTIVPDLTLDPVPTLSGPQAAAVAIAKVQGDLHPNSALGSRSTKLYVFRTGLAQGVAGEAHLVWQVEVTGSPQIREFVYIDAHTGKFVDQITGIYDALNRRVFDGENATVYPPPNYPANPFWVEGQALPTGVSDADSIITTSREIYDLYRNAFGRDSFDGAGATMEAIFNSGTVRGDATWNGRLTQFGSGLGADDVTAHEWTHAYTQYTDGLIYQWQPGALNEAYSDIFGETIDLLNSEGLDLPAGVRQGNNCNFNWRPKPLLHVNSPAALQGDYASAPASFGAPFSLAGLTGNVVLVDDGVGTGTPPEPSRTDGCQTPFRNAAQVNGNIALIDRSQFGTCSYAEKVKNAQLNGAIAVIIANDIVEGETPRPMPGEDPSITIPAALVGYRDGQVFRRPRARTLNVTLRSDGSSGDNSYRWLIGEDVSVIGVGTIGARDMWQPPCNGHPGKTSDREYFCGAPDNGGVHENSGIPNHAYALLVDGGTYNGQTIQALGFTKAAHIYFRAMSVYQTPTSDFADHAEALEASASDLIGANLPDLLTGLPSGQIITNSDLQQVHNATLAVEMRNPPVQCGFRPLLAKNPPVDSCTSPAGTQATIFSDDFEADPTSQWNISREVGDPTTFIARDWVWVHNLPGGHAGSGFFARDLLDDCLSPVPGQVGVLHLDSPLITLPRVMTGGPHLSFDHWVATEAGYDGAQLLISVNNGPFKLVTASAFLYNAYNTTLFPAAPGFEILYNPRAGQPAFSGTDRGSLEGSWGVSIIDLSAFAHSGDRIRLRWDLSTDYCFGTNSGWYVDNVRLYSCSP
jgi:Zn-dependent metalloprotease